MLTNNLKLAFRNLNRNKLYTLINLTGLSVASAFCILTYWYVKNERSYDNFHHDQDRLFRVEQTDLFTNLRGYKPQKSLFSFLTKDADQKNMIQTPLVLAGDLKQNFPEIESTIRLGNYLYSVVRVHNESFREDDQSIVAADQDFFKVLNYPLLYGDPKSVLADPHQAVISERAAVKYFGSAASAIGKTLEFTNNKQLFTVAGIAKNFPANSSFQYDIVVPRLSDPDYNGQIKQGTNSFSELLIIKLKQGVDAAKFERKLAAWGTKYYQPMIDKMRTLDSKTKYSPMQIYLRPLNEAHYNQSQGWPHFTDLKNIYQFICLSAIILIIASVNYILLTLTNTISRSQDVGIRKTIGASRKQIIRQYYTETQILSLLAVITGFLLAVACLPVFNNVTGGNIQLANISITEVIVYLLILSMVLGVLAGIYPALVMSGLRPLSIIKGFSTYKISPILSNVLVTVQFGICVVFIISSMVINKQIRFVSNAQMGFDKDQVVLIKNPYGWTEQQKSGALRERFYHYVSTQPMFQDVTATTFGFAMQNRSGFIIDGERTYAQSMGIDYNYFSFNKIPIVKGRGFSPELVSDSASIKLSAEQHVAKSSTVEQALVVNQTLYNMLGKPQLNTINPIIGARIIGVCKDYHTQDLTQKIEPAYHTIAKQPFGYYWVKIRAGQSIPAALERLHAVWSRITDNGPFTYTFLDEDVKKSYESYTRWMQTVNVCCVLAILIACLGLFGLSGVTTINRTKEIGIRKILGASVANLFILINKGTFRMAVIGLLVAAPIAVYLANKWLDNFAYRIKTDWKIILASAVIAVITAIVAVSYHTLKTALVNPVKSLRNE